MEIVVNGEARALSGAVNVAELLTLLAVPAQRLAVEVNREIVPRSTYATHYIRHGDQVEIVRAVGGG